MGSLAELTEDLATRCSNLSLSAPVTHVYNPLVYARRPHAEYLQRYGRRNKKVLFIGINPGPWGMAQSGVPFGDVEFVKNWMGIEAKVDAPAQLHPKRPVQGFSCKRREISGSRLWGLFQSRFGSAEAFFRENMVMNYCPLLFSHISGNKCTNITPDKLVAGNRRELYSICDAFLHGVVEKHLKPEYLVGVGTFAETMLRNNFPKAKIVRILHPSPANPAANKGFAAAATLALEKAGIW